MPQSPLTVFTLLCLGIEAIVGLVLGLSSGLSELHKTVLVGFVVGFPAPALILFLILLLRAERTIYTPFRSRKATAPDPPTTPPVNGV